MNPSEILEKTKNISKQQQCPLGKVRCHCCEHWGYNIKGVMSDTCMLNHVQTKGSWFCDNFKIKKQKGD